MNFFVTNPVHFDPIRFVTVFNDETVPVSPFGLMRVKSLRDDGILVVGYPTKSNQTTLVANGPMPIPQKEYGQGTLSFPAVVAIDQAGKNPEPGDEYGTVAGKWNLQRGGTGFQVMAVQPDTNVVGRVLVDKRFGFGSVTRAGLYLNGVLSYGQAPFPFDITGYTSATGSAYTGFSILLPDSGTWLIKYVVSGSIKCNAESGQTPVPALLSAGLYALNNTEMVTPLNGSPTFGSAIYGIVASAVTTDENNHYVGQGTCTLSAVFRTTGVLPSVYAIGYPYIKGNPIIDTHYCEYQIFNVFSTPLPFGFPTTHVMGYKLSD